MQSHFGVPQSEPQSHKTNFLQQKDKNTQTL